MNGIEISVTGNVTRDPELRFGNNGNPWVTLGIAVNSITTIRGEKTEETEFLNLKAFRETAQNIADSVSKGMRVMVSGKLKTESWTDQSGTERKAVVLIVDEIGPSLRWASATVVRNARSDNGGGRGGDYGGNNSSSRQVAPAAAPAASGGASHEGDSPFGMPEEDPF